MYAALNFSGWSERLKTGQDRNSDNKTNNSKIWLSLAINNNQNLIIVMNLIWSNQKTLRSLPNK